MTKTNVALSKNRLEALADGIFAIAMTLLVLEIRVPDLAKTASPGELAGAIGHEVPTLFGFFITFLLASFFWFFHHATFRHFHTLRAKMAVVNLAFLMFVSLLPFSTGLLSRFQQNSTAQAFYFGNQLALGILLAIHWTMVKRQAKANPNPSQDEREQLWTLDRIYIFPVAYGVAVVAAFFIPQWTFAVFMVCMLAGRIVHRKRA